MLRQRLPIRPIRPPLVVDEILRWTDEWFALHGNGPNINSDLIPGTNGNNWQRVDDSLPKGYRGLRKRSGLSPARLLERRRGVRNPEYPPRLSETKIVKWARSYPPRTGKWPKSESGPISDAPGESWRAVDMRCSRILFVHDDSNITQCIPTRAILLDHKIIEDPIII